jgi:hypothetical protein
VSLFARAAILTAVVAILIALPHAVPAAAAAKSCVSAEEARVHAAGDSSGEDEGAPPKFTAAFYSRLLTLDVSLDGADGNELPVSIEEVCDVPKKLKKQAAQLAGSDGVALLLHRTTIQQGPTLLTGESAATALEGADTAILRVRLARPRKWREDEDGNRVPTFRTGRVEITD